MNRTFIRVLLVEDEEAHAELIQRAFEPRGGLMSLTVARSLREARAVVDKSPPDLVLIDLLLPDGKGTDLLPSGGEEAPFPMIIMTSHGNEKVAVEAMKAGALHYVVKSANTLADMPQIVEGALREWGHIVERRRAEEALQRSEEHFRSLIENALDIITVIEQDGTIRYTSPAIEEALGYLASAWVGSNFFDLVHGDDQEHVREKVALAFSSGGETQLMRYRCRHKDGNLRVFEAIGSSHRRLDGPLQGVINARDVTDRHLAEEAKNKLEDQLRHSQKWEIIGNLAGGIANEFNNMLTPILGFASLAMEEVAPGTKIYKRLEHILTAANRSKDLAEQLLSFSRQSEPLRKPVRLQSVVDEALKLIRPSLPPSIEVRRTIAEECPAVNADPDQMRQVLMNLCSYAADAMPDGGVLGVRLQPIQLTEGRARAGTYARLTVTDTGHGMDDHAKESLLEPFSGNRALGETHSLGLAVTHGIVVSHGGELSIDSEPGKGTTLHVFIPLDDGAKRAAEGSSEEPSSD